MEQEFSQEVKVKRDPSGVTLLEILIGMLILGLVTGGIFTAFVFGRRVNIRSETELVGYTCLQATMEQVRLSVGGNSPGGLPKSTPGVYVDDKLANAGAFVGGSFKTPPGAGVPKDGSGNPIVPNPLNLPPEFQTKYQTNPGTANDWNNHGDGMVMVVEKSGENNNGIADEDLDADGKIGLDFNGDRKTDLYRVRLYLKKTTPSTK